eukprot:scaffold49383_cov27-Tisochrysis_lutea.AAC.11
MGNRSLLASVSIILSSITLVRFSTHVGSIGPSSTIQVNWRALLFALRQMGQKAPSRQVPSDGSTCPKSCVTGIDFGLSRTSSCPRPKAGGDLSEDSHLPSAA